MAEKCFDFEATAGSIEEMLQLRSYLKAVSDDTNLSHDEKMKRVHAIHFGWGRENSAADGREKFKEGN